MGLDSRNPHNDGSGIGVIALVPENWGGQWMGRHQVLTRLAARYPVVWVNKRPGWREAWSTRDSGTTPQPAREAQPGVPGFSILEATRVCPKVYRPKVVREALDKASVRRACRRLSQLGCTRFVFSVWRPEFVDEIKLFPDIPVIYHVADEYSFSSVEEPTSEIERDMLSRCRVAICVSDELAKKKGTLARKHVVIPNGVDFGLFSNAADEPPVLRSIPHPRVGYVGGIKRQLDIKLLAEAAEMRPDWTYVYVGPMGNIAGVEADVKRLLALPNVRWLGIQSVVDLPAFVRHLDVGLMPYIVDDYTKYIAPLKLYEYLATGLPVVSSRIAAVRAVVPHVKVAGTPQEWIDAIELALRPEERQEDAVSARLQLARQFDWQAITDRIATEVRMATGG